MSGSIAVTIRPVDPGDVPALCDLLNEVIRVGGATIFERPITVEAFIDHFFKSQIQISFLVAAADTGELLGFQVLLTHEQLPDDWADIATFARVGSQALEIGRALFAETVMIARRFGLLAINATIRADNEGGQAYYDAMGFVTYKVDEKVPLKSGYRVDRISKGYRVISD
ncbi:MAG: GNAT family N-acetyltransferase [Ahrensia sp.]|nr:GNAT family N-acetyltransferase [Ahrensia sp.]|tara:strand:+ start:1132 stop:1641 length:510 start_codon:yes stop_codon:yes gene_type:complete